MTEHVGVVRVAYSAIEDGHCADGVAPPVVADCFYPKRGVEGWASSGAWSSVGTYRRLPLPATGGDDLNALPRGTHGFTGGDLRP